MEPIILSIEERLHPEFKESAQGKRMGEITPNDLEFVPFGPDYKGSFTLKYPTLRDRTEIAKIQTRELTKGSFPSWQLLPQTINDMEYAFAVVECLGIDTPKWFNKDELATELDKLAVIEVGIAFNEGVELKKKRPSETSNPKL